MRLITSLLFISLMLSCGSLRHYRKVAIDEEVTEEKKALLSSWVSKNFPVTPEYIKGDSVVIVDTTFNQSLVDSLTSSLDSLISNQIHVDLDSLKAEIKRQCKPKTIYRTRTRVDTLRVVDEALVTSLKSQVDSVSKQNQLLTLQLEESENKNGNKLYYLVGAMVVAVFQAYMLARKKKKKK